MLMNMVNNTKITNNNVSKLYEKKIEFLKEENNSLKSYKKYGILFSLFLLITLLFIVNKPENINETNNGGNFKHVETTKTFEIKNSETNNITIKKPTQITEASKIVKNNKTKNVNSVSEISKSDISSFLEILSASGFIFGFVASFYGIFLIYKSSTNNDEEAERNGFMFLVMGIIISILPLILSNVITVEPKTTANNVVNNTVNNSSW